LELPPRPGNSTRERVRSSSPRPLLATEHLRVTEVEALRAQVRNAEHEGRYLDADAHRAAIRETRRQHGRQLTQVMLDVQRVHLEEVREAHRAEVQQFHAQWQWKMKVYEEHVAGVRQALELQQAEDLEALAQRLQAETEPRAPRYSKLYHQRRSVEQQAKRTRRYRDAAAAKEEADRIRELDEEDWRQKREAKISALKVPFMEKQERERAALEHRIAIAKESFAKVRAEELEVLLKRGQCVVSEIEQQQRIKALKVQSNPLVHSPFTLVPDVE